MIIEEHAATYAYSDASLKKPGCLNWLYSLLISLYFDGEVFKVNEQFSKSFAFLSKDGKQISVSRRIFNFNCYLTNMYKLKNLYMAFKNVF